jgi:hypothetical protein
VNFEKLKKQLTSWLVNFVAKPNPAFSNMPVCPYALQAYQDNKIKFECVEERLYGKLIEYVDNWDDDYDIVVMFVDEIYLPRALPSIINTANRYLMPADLVALEDHPDIPEVINKVKVNFGKSTVVFVQRLSKINEASQHLKDNTEYYKHWSKENLDYTVDWRFKD